MYDLKLYGKTDKGLKSLIQTVRVFSSEICMEFGTEKCNIRILKRGIKDENCDILLQNNLKIFSLKERWELQVSRKTWAEDINTKKMKEKLKTEYLKRTRKVLDSKLNSENLLRVINTWEVSLFCYSAVYIDWKKEEYQKLIEELVNYWLYVRQITPKTIYIGCASK